MIIHTKYFYLLYWICDNQRFEIRKYYLIFSSVNGYFKENYGKNYLTLVPINGSKEKK